MFAYSGEGLTEHQGMFIGIVVIIVIAACIAVAAFFKRD